MALRCFQVSVPGAKSYVAAKQHRSGGRKRTEGCIAKVWHLYRDSETDCDTRLTSLRASEALPMSVAFISISPDTYPVQSRFDCSPFQRPESTLKLLCVAFGKDPVCANVGRIPRTPGYLGCKYDTTYSITVEYPSDSTTNPDDFRLDIAGANATFCPAQFHRKNTLESRQIPNLVGCGFGMTLPMEKTPEKSANVGFASRDLPWFSFTTPSGPSMSQSANLWLVGGIPMDDFLRTPQAKQAYSTLRICKGASRDAGEHSGWWLTSSARPLGCVRY